MAKNEAITELSSDLQAHLEGEKLVLLATGEAETNIPNVTAISWVKSVDAKKIRFTVTNNSRIITNIKANPHVVFTVIGLETVYSIQGKANILEETMDGVSLKLSKVEVEVEQVFESMFWGAKITQEPEYEKTYNLEKAKKLDEEVYTALMK
jgi:uncharacterized pyridoxamine 5'-phosphate oxidase family protein